MKVIHMRVSDRLYRRLQMEAKWREIRVSTLARLIIANYFSIREEDCGTEDAEGNEEVNVNKEGKGNGRKLLQAGKDI